MGDAPARFTDVGHMGARGVDVALESADIVLVNDRLAQIPYLLKLSQKAMVIAKQNPTHRWRRVRSERFGLFRLTPL